MEDTNMKIANNLISKPYGIDDHMPADKCTDLIFPQSEKYMDIVKRANEETGEEEEYGPCIKNLYKSDEWIKALIKTEQYSYVGKDKSLYLYCIDYDGICKPTGINFSEEELYKLSNGVFYFDFDHIDKQLICEIKMAFDKAKRKNKCYQWFEYSWSGHGCHIRCHVNFVMKSKLEWGFYYFHLLNGIVNNVYIDYRQKVIESIDWRCATITRGFSIPYNKNGVYESEFYDPEEISPITTIEELEKVFNYYKETWEDEIYEHFLNAFVKKEKNRQLKLLFKDIDNEKGWKYRYVFDNWDFNVDHKMVDGETYDYNWRLSLVTTLMGVFNKDKNMVRDICKVIYKYIKPYKNHTYNEMINNELERKIFNRANFDLEPSHNILKELWDDWGLQVKIYKNI